MKLRPLAAVRWVLSGIAAPFRREFWAPGGQLKLTIDTRALLSDRLLHFELGKVLTVEQVEALWRQAWALARETRDRFELPVLRAPQVLSGDVVPAPGRARLLRVAFEVRREGGWVYPWIPGDEDAIRCLRVTDGVIFYGDGTRDEPRLFAGISSS